MRKAVEVTPGFCILWSLLLLVLPLHLILAAMGAALVHELCHWAVIRLLGGQVLGLTVGAGGMEMETQPMRPGRELVCALAGPAGSMMLILLYPYAPLLSLCALVQGCFNLLPLYPLDGGRAVRCVLEILGHQGWIQFIEIGTLLFLLIAAVGVRMGPIPFIVWAMLAFRKIPCKDGRIGVQ